MVFENAKNKILSVISDHIVKYGNGIDVTLKLEDLGGECCRVEIPTALEALGYEFFERLEQAIEKIPCVEGLWDRAQEYGLLNGKPRQIEINVADGYYVETDEEARRWDDQMRLQSNSELRKQVEEKEHLSKLSHWKDYILPVPDPPPHYSDQVYLTLAYEPYDMIKCGKKTTEFRAYTPNYAKRLLSHPLKTVKFQRGYGGPGRPKPEQMVFEITRIDLYDIMTRTSSDPDNPTPIIPTHFAIDLGRRIE